VAEDRTREAAALGLKWLGELQNRDGGMPTFCRGWGNLPFDRSSADLTAHTLRAINAWASPWDDRLSRGMIAFLKSQQRPDGSWLPLWFGNQHAGDDENPTYGTARVLLAASSHLGAADAWGDPVQQGIDWILNNQNEDGGWGGGKGTPSSIEETAHAIEALAHFADPPIQQLRALHRGVDWLIARTDQGQRFDPAPIGFYFAKLWYYEKLYPVISTVAALNAVKKITANGREKRE
jgi:squalene-hopene/tetraprenyl-beta-curcumene cyclase